MNKSDESEKVISIARLQRRAIEVLGDQEAAQIWLKSPIKGLGNKIPLECARTESGKKEVEDLLNRIEAGVFS